MDKPTDRDLETTRHTLETLKEWYEEHAPEATGTIARIEEVLLELPMCADELEE